MYFSLFFGVLTFVFGQYRKLGLSGIVLTLIGFALGGYSIEVGSVEAKKLSLGVDWMILAFLGSAFIFMSLEKVFPKYKNQVILRKEWGLDLAYFCFNHLAISAIILYGNYHASHFDWALNPDLQATIQSIPLLVQVEYLCGVCRFASGADSLQPTFFFWIFALYFCNAAIPSLASWL